METNRNKERQALMNTGPVTAPEQVLFAQSPDGSKIVGVVTNAPPSSLALLAVGVAGMAARQLRRESEKKNP